MEQSGENQVSIRKVVTPVEGNNGVGKATRVELIINFEEDAPLGYYTVSDSIPSGMRLMTYQKNEEDYRSVWIENENQQITAQIYRDTPRDETEEEQQKWKERRIVYYISGVLPGEYVVESACLSNPADEILYRQSARQSWWNRNVKKAGQCGSSRCPAFSAGEKIFWKKYS